MEQLVINHLYKLGNNEIQPFNSASGLCNDICWVFDAFIAQKLLYYMLKWPKYSGNNLYPISHSILSPTDAYNKLENLWDNNEYGNSRRELCLWLAKQLEGEE